MKTSFNFLHKESPSEWSENSDGDATQQLHIIKINQGPWYKKPIKTDFLYQVLLMVLSFFISILGLSTTYASTIQQINNIRANDAGLGLAALEQIQLPAWTCPAVGLSISLVLMIVFLWVKKFFYFIKEKKQNLG